MRANDRKRQETVGLMNDGGGHQKERDALSPAAAFWEGSI